MRRYHAFSRRRVLSAIMRRGAPQRVRARIASVAHTRAALTRYKEMGDEPLVEPGDE